MRAGPSNPTRPSPNDPPRSYRIEGGDAIFYRRVSSAELASVRASGRLSAPPDGIALGKHLTTTVELALAWGERMVARGWETEVGYVLELRLGVKMASKIEHLGVIDGIGSCYFATLEELAGVRVTEVKDERQDRG